VIVARNPGIVKQATLYAERLSLKIAVIHGELKESDSDVIDGRNSPPLTTIHLRTMDVGVGIPQHPVKEKPPIYVVGDVGNRIAIIVVSKKKNIYNNIINESFLKSKYFFQDNMIDDITSFITAAEVLKKHGAYKIYVLAIHGLLSSEAPKLIESSPIDEVN